MASNFPKNFATYEYKHTKSYNGIAPSMYIPPPGVLTMNSTMRAFWDSQAEVHITCIYRWPQLPVAKFLRENAEDFGKRFGINAFIVPTKGAEELFWLDAYQFLKVINEVEQSNPFVIDDTGIYLLISGSSPQNMFKNKAPFILLNVNKLIIAEVIGLISKLLSIFNTEINELEIVTKKDKKSPGRALLCRDNLADNKELIKQALKVFAEIYIVIQNINISFHWFKWDVKNEFNTIIKEIKKDANIIKKLNKIKDDLKQIKDDYKSDISQINMSNIVSEGKKNKSDIFLCHRKQDKQFVLKLYKALKRKGLNVWLDSYKIKWGDNIITKISNGIKQSKYVIICIGKTFKDGKYTKYELEMAMRDEIVTNNKKVLPLLLTESKEETKILLEEVPILRAKSYKTIECGIDTLVDEITSMIKNNE